MREGRGSVRGYYLGVWIGWRSRREKWEMGLLKGAVVLGFVRGKVW